MAYIGIARPVIAVYSEENGKAAYSGGIRFGKAIKIEINPQYEDVSDYNDINDTDDEEEFAYADITLDTDEIPEEAEPIMFGQETDGISKESVAPSVGAWIEIAGRPRHLRHNLSLPSWERGLKYGRTDFPGCLGSCSPCGCRNCAWMMSR